MIVYILSGGSRAAECTEVLQHAVAVDETVKVYVTRERRIANDLAHVVDVDAVADGAAERCEILQCGSVEEKSVRFTVGGERISGDQAGSVQRGRGARIATE